MPTTKRKTKIETKKKSRRKKRRWLVRMTMCQCAPGDHFRISHRFPGIIGSRKGGIIKSETLYEVGRAIKAKLPAETQDRVWGVKATGCMYEQCNYPGRFYRVWEMRSRGRRAIVSYHLYEIVETRKKDKKGNKEVKLVYT